MSSLFCTDERGVSMMHTNIQRPKAETLSLIVALDERLHISYDLIICFVGRITFVFLTRVSNPSVHRQASVSCALTRNLAAATQRRLS